jgi:hypothetical protein
MSVNMPNEDCRYIKVVVKNANLSSESSKNIMLLDEITVE